MINRKKQSPELKTKEHSHKAPVVLEDPFWVWHYKYFRKVLIGLMNNYTGEGFTVNQYPLVLQSLPYSSASP